ncbi:hypothetical protein SAMN05216241_10968 [Limimonas halophila]|uniref:Transmembrane protein (PGPGW) n=1 Tax=Limimonas halophila TaxID=1082479 RepID=A0A1G7TFV0_9PROT|nr:hypothetical protein [Limimonas halophila]SDG34105.1 hypothetical protein SAMN05216241_10968 [Limimonas halophila]
MRKRRNRFRAVLAATGALLVVVGVPLFISPIPLGALVVGVGLALLWRTSGRARLVRRVLRRRRPVLAERLDRLLGAAPRRNRHKPDDGQVEP